MPRISKDTHTSYKIRMSEDEFKKALGIPGSLTPLLVHTGVYGVEITCSGSLPDPDPEPRKTRWWHKKTRS